MKRHLRSAHSSQLKANPYGLPGSADYKTPELKEGLDYCVSGLYFTKYSW